ncbi:MAG: GPR endopeptidase [Lachnospiraceae bacterium]|jgi:spore protease|nr:GPR endopeptidase [Lachnospiraceae bacterium]MCX4378716.1 GPR endopeptidase [Lachnospiraceae bacterium]
MQQFQIRTDLALEATESVKKKEAGQLRGVSIEEYDVMEDVHISKVVIMSKNAAKSMGKPTGTYITLEAPDLQESDEDYHREISEELAKQLRSVLPDIGNEKSILVVGLGNRDVTADALGPSTVDNLFITRHIIREYGKQAYHASKMHQISALVPGVMAKTGMETAEIIKGVIKVTEPDIVIVIDALAARSVKRLNRTVQITDTGIHPGSGVGNHRNALTKESLGIPVIAIGIPMVVDAGTIVCDALEKLSQEYDEGKASLDYFRNNADTQLHNMYVTAKNIDETTKRLSFTLSEAINIALDMEA